MPFTFVMRSLYDNPTGKFIRHFPDHSILEWFQENWNAANASIRSGRELSEQLIGKCVYGFSSLFDNIQEHSIPVPQNTAQLSRILEKHIYAELYTKTAEHIIEVFTDDDERDLRYFFIEDEFASTHAARCQFLLHDGWLPTATTTTSPESEPCTYLYIHGPIQSADSQVWDRVVCRGMNLSGGPAKTIASYETLAYAEAQEILKHLIAGRSKCNTWLQVLEFLIQQISDDSAAGPNGNSQLICSEHICQLQLHSATLQRYNGGRQQLFDQVIVFDNIWAASYPNFARSIEYYASDRCLIQ